MSRIFYRPMFRTGGSSNSGITSGLRQGYDPGGSVGKRVVDVRQQMADAGIKARDPKQNFWNFLMSSGLDLASRSPQGNILQTAAASARDHLPTMQAGIRADQDYEDKLNLSAFDIIRAEDQAEKDFNRQKELIKYEADVNPKLKKVFREEIPEVRINNYADTLKESEFDIISNNAMEISQDIVTFNVFKEKNPEHAVNKKNFRGILQFEYDAKGKATPNYSSYIVGQVFYNPEDGLFYEKIADEGAITDFKALDPFTYD